MGGSDDPSNIVSLTVEEHANAHKELWEKYNHKEDWIAWKGLSGCISGSEINYMKSVIGGLKTKGRIKSPEECQKLKDCWTEERRIKNGLMAKERQTGKKHSSERIAKMRLVKPKQDSIQKMKETQIRNNYGGKPISTPFGNFQSMKECKRKTGLDTATIRYRAKKQIMGYKFLSESTT